MTDNEARLPRGCSRIMAATLMLIVSAFHAPSPGAEIVSLAQSATTVGQYEKLEVTLTLDTTYENPFDPEVVDVAAIVAQPDGTQVRVPAFYDREFQVVGADPEAYRNPGPPAWKIRFAPSLIGPHRFAVVVSDSSGVTTRDSAGSFTCVASSRRGPIRRHPTNPLFVAYDDGSPRLNIGHNVCWVAGGVAGWQDYFTSMAATGENWTRLWMCPWGSEGGTLLEYRQDHSSGYFEGAGAISLQIAQRLDRVIESAEANGVAIQLVLQYHGAFSTSTDANWSSNPYNTVQGGFLSDPAQFFTDTEARRLTRNKYRYIVARWGYSPAILAWELWNEVQFTDGWKSDRASVVTWHEEMADYIRGVDPFDHLITTSSDSSGFENLWSLPDIDLVQVHHYHGPVIPAFVDAADRLAKYEKPIIMGEFGAGSVGTVSPAERYPEELPEPYRSHIYDGLVLHNGIWSAFHVASSAHLWWWDYYIDKLDLYDRFEPLAIYAAGEDVAAQGLSKAPTVVQGGQAIQATPGLTDFWAVSTQREFTLVEGVFPGTEYLSQWLHGTSKSAYRSDPVFHLDTSVPGYFIIHVVQVSGWGSNSLRVRVDGSPVFASAYANGASNFDIQVPLTAGMQSVQVENTGQDWFWISGYEFAPEEEALLASIGLVGPRRAYLWIYDKGSQFGQQAHGMFEDEVIRVAGLEEGTYDVHAYATWGPGGVMGLARADTEGGILSYTLPDFEKDIAIKILPVSRVDMGDLTAMAGQWCTQAAYPFSDVTQDGLVNVADLRRLADVWLQPCPPEWPASLR